MGIKDIQKGRSDVYKVSPADLKVKDGWNSRDASDPENIEYIYQLAISIHAVGVKEPLTIYQDEGEFFIENGHCRREASLLVLSGFDYGDKHYDAIPDLVVPVIVSGKDTTEAERVFSQIIRNSGKPLSPIEQGIVFDKLVKLETPVTEIARKAGFSRVYVHNLLNLVNSSEAIQKLVKDGSVAASLAILALKVAENDKEALKLLKDAIKEAKEAGKLRATEKHLKKAAGKAASDEDGEGEGEGEKKPKKNKEKKEKKEKADKPPTLKEEVAEILDSYVAEKTKDGYVKLIVDDEQYARLKELLGIDPLPAEETKPAKGKAAEATEDEPETTTEDDEDFDPEAEEGEEGDAEEGEPGNDDDDDNGVV